MHEFDSLSSWLVPIVVVSMMLTFGVQRPQLAQRTGLTEPRPLRFLPPLRRFLVILYVDVGDGNDNEQSFSNEDGRDQLTSNTLLASVGPNSVC